MLLSRRGTWVPAWEAGLMEHCVMHSRYTVGVQMRRGVTLAPALFAGSGRIRRRLGAPRCFLVVNLGGRARLVGMRQSRELPVGYVGICGERGWTLHNEGDCTALLVDWEPGFLTTAQLVSAPPLPLAPLTLQRLRDEAAALTAAETDERSTPPIVARILALLAAEGFPFDPVESGELVEALEAWEIPLAREMDRAISNLAANPMLSDFERRLGWSERSIRRRLAQLQNRTHSATKGGWREVVQAWRLYAGVALMSHPAATTEEVAHLLGYSSPVAFCGAFAQAGLPSPGAIRSALRNL